MAPVTASQALRFRWRAQQLDAPADSAAVDAPAVLDLGVQDGANHAGRLALTNRGVAVDEAIRVLSDFSDDLLLAWTLRGAPHLYRRSDAGDVQRAVSPFDEDDATRRAISGGKAVSKDGGSVLDALGEVAAAMRDACADPTPKGEVSTALHATLPAVLQVDCRPCKATHPHEQLFRLAALHGGLELQPGTNPPVLRRIPGWRRKPGTGDPAKAADQFGVVRGYLRFLGPAAPAHVAAFLDTSVAQAKAHWPDDVVEVTLEGSKRWILADDADALADAADPGGDASLRLLSGFDLFTAAKDRDLLAPKPRHAELWPSLGRPGVIARDGELLGTWRPKSTGATLTVTASLWAKTDPGVTAQVEEQADLVARSRGQRLAGVTFG
ncbi:DNA glycosylase AlkZ-like family protein [Nigerium massiliense]|uniref:DNA glycosylase AlkZ-like family protein n=1 Tax=Nigerium massiliense TaxID=1522317 RepID=UPI00058C2282|nr:crosslink repair DNA glycosylase YcaQ family protein [Nigerium massiliense]